MEPREIPVTVLKHLPVVLSVCHTAGLHAPGLQVSEGLGGQRDPESMLVSEGLGGRRDPESMLVSEGLGGQRDPESMLVSEGLGGRRDPESMLVSRVKLTFICPVTKVRYASVTAGTQGFPCLAFKHRGRCSMANMV